MYFCPLDEAALTARHAGVLTLADLIEGVAEMPQDVELVEQDAGLGGMARGREPEGLPHVHPPEPEPGRFPGAQPGTSTKSQIIEYMTFAKPVQSFTTEGSFTAKNAAMNVGENSIAMFGETLPRVLGDEEARKEMGAAGRRRVEGELQWEMQKRELKKSIVQF